MFSPEPVRISLRREEAELDAALDALPEQASVFLLAFAEGQEPYLGRCANLRRRAKRLLRASESPARLPRLRGLARELVYWPAASSLEANLVLLDQARSHFQGRYRSMLRLRLPFYLRLLTKNRFPRVMVSSQPGDPASTFGPFLYRSQAEDFSGRALDLFLLRRCDEELEPAPKHPGCIYGEMKLCLRPCQAAVSDARYREEADAFLRFLADGGNFLRNHLELQREEASVALDFEAAARAHKRLQKLNECWQGLSSLCALLVRLHGVAVTPGSREGEVRLWPVLAARLHPPVTLPLDGLGSRVIAASLAEVTSLAGMPGRPLQASPETMQEALAVLTKWAVSSWCDGEWVGFEDPATPPSRKISNAARRVNARRWETGVTSEEGVAPDETKVLPSDDG
ncbi:MAG: hypothetical protein IT170_04655 [Bryobacterales bacterium]|nr:hypothetical protein [Bryobacterales bacterium]